MSVKPGQKTVLITGCTPGGIGHALCLEFHKQGLHVIATARDTKCLVEMADMGMSTVELDVTNKESIAACHQKVDKITGGKLDILVNNAGRTHTHPATDLDMDDVRATFETNVFGVMAMVASFVDLLIPARGLVINIASIAAITPYVFGSAYCASKGAVTSYSRTLRLELRPFGVRVMVVMAGTVRSNIAARTHRTLPPGSLYARVADLFQRRLTFSQNNATVRTEDFAARLVRNALAAETPGGLPFLKAWWGRRDWYYDGGMSKVTWLALSLLGEWVMDLMCWRMFGLEKLRVIVEQDRANAKKLK